MEEGDLKSLSPSTNSEGLSEEEEKILLEKEFDDYYEKMEEGDLKSLSPSTNSE